MKIDKNNYEAFFLDYSEGNLSDDQIVELLLFLELNPDLKVELELFEMDLKLEPENISAHINIKKILDVNQSDEELIIAYLEDDLSLKEKNFIEEKLKSDSAFKRLYQSFNHLKLKPQQDITLDKDCLLPIDINSSNYEELFIAYHEGDLNLINRKQVEHYAKENKLERELRAISKLKLKADQSLVFQNKNELKRKEGRVIPLYAWISSAAALFLLFFVLSKGWNNEETIVEEDNIEAPSKQMEIRDNSKAILEETLPLVEEKEVANKEEIRFALETPSKQEENSKESFKTVRNSTKKIEPSIIKQDIAGLEKPSEKNTDILEIPKEKEKEVHQQEPQLELPEDRIADLNKEDKELKNDSQKESSNNTLNIITLAENATRNSDLISFNSNLNETAQYNETSISIGKFSFSRKTKRKSKS